jgi:hypothetical protein
MRRPPPIATGKARLMERLQAKAEAASAPPIEELSIACVGARHPNPKRKGQPTGAREMEILFAARGDPVTLTPEPENKHDENAIAVYSQGEVQIGYVSAERTLLIHRAWHDAREVYAVFQERTPWGVWLRVGFGRVPTLPPVVTVQPDVVEPDAIDQAGGDDFYPDPIYED